MSPSTSSPRPFVYVESDIPAGLTLAEWRRARAVPCSHHPVRVALRRLTVLVAR